MKQLIVKDLTKNINNKNILDNISFDIEQGEIIGFVGKNGAGKTTIIKCIAGLYSFDSGEININGYNIKTNFEEALSKVGFIIENPEMYSNLSGLKNLKIWSLLYGKVDKIYLKELIKKVKLEKRINDKVATYSLGMKQRLGLVQALMHKPSILILDEPTNGLDPVGIMELRDILLGLKNEKNITILIASHMLSELENICDRFIMVDNGKIINQVKLENLKNENKSLEDLFKFDMEKRMEQIK